MFGISYITVSSVALVKFLEGTLDSVLKSAISRLIAFLCIQKLYS